MDNNGNNNGGNKPITKLEVFETLTVCLAILLICALTTIYQLGGM